MAKRTFMNKKTTNKGGALLELSIFIPFILWVILAFIDVNNKQVSDTQIRNYAHTAVKMLATCAMPESSVRGYLDYEIKKIYNDNSISVTVTFKEINVANVDAKLISAEITVPKPKYNSQFVDNTPGTVTYSDIIPVACDKDCHVSPCD
jgi:hypothetical protein